MFVERIKVAGILVPSWNTDGKPPAGIQKLLLEHLQKTILDRIAAQAGATPSTFLPLPMCVPPVPGFVKVGLDARVSSPPDTHVKQSSIQPGDAGPARQAFRYHPSLPQLLRVPRWGHLARIVAGAEDCSTTSIQER